MPNCLIFESHGPPTFGCLSIPPHFRPSNHHLSRILDLPVFVMNLVIVQVWRRDREELREEVVRDEESAHTSALCVGKYTKEGGGGDIIEMMIHYYFSGAIEGLGAIGKRRRNPGGWGGMCTTYPRQRSQVPKRATSDAPEYLVRQQFRPHRALLRLFHQFDLVIDLKK